MNSTCSSLKERAPQRILYATLFQRLFSVNSFVPLFKDNALCPWNYHKWHKQKLIIGMTSFLCICSTSLNFPEMATDKITCGIDQITDCALFLMNHDEQLPPNSHMNNSQPQSISVLIIINSLLKNLCVVSIRMF